MPEIGRHLYLIQSGHTGAVKVGRSSDPPARLKQLQTGCPYPLRLILVLPDQGHLERALHRRLARGRTLGGEEWFSHEVLGELPDRLYNMLDLDTVDWWWTREGRPPANKPPEARP